MADLSKLSDEMLLKIRDQGVESLSDDELLSLKSAMSGEPEKEGIGETVVKQGLQGLSLGTSDEIQAFGEALYGAAFEDKNFGDTYNKRQKELQAELERQREQNPVTSIASNIGGALVNPLNFLLPGAASVGGMVARGAAEGALYGAASAKQGERLEGGAIGAVTGGAVSGAIGALSKSPKLVSGMVRRLKGETPKDEVTKSLQNVLGANSSQMTKLEQYVPDLEKTILENNVVKGRFASRFGMHNQVKEGLKKHGEVIDDIVNTIDDAGAAPISNVEVANKLREYAKQLNPRLQKKVIRQINKEADDVAESTGLLSAKQAFQDKVASGDLAFKSSIDPKGSIKDENLWRAYNSVYDDLFKDRVAQTMPDKLPVLLESNKQFSNLKKLDQVLQANKTKKSAGLIDKVTIGSVFAAQKNLPVAAAFFGGREIGKKMTPNLRFLNKGAAKANKGAFTRAFTASYLLGDEE